MDKYDKVVPKIKSRMSELEKLFHEMSDNGESGYDNTKNSLLRLIDEMDAFVNLIIPDDFEESKI